jgi:hypothetical protein
MLTRSRENFIHFFEPKRIAITDAHLVVCEIGRNPDRIWGMHAKWEISMVN